MTKAIKVDDVAAIRDWVNGKASTLQSNITAEATARANADTTLTNSVNTINGKIPAQATASNQLADKAYVNSSVQTATANFRGNWDTWSQVPTDASNYPADYAGSTTPTTNDYLVVQDASDYPVAQGEDALAGTWRFKYSGVWSTNGKAGWQPEYQVNETPLTSAQLDAINSGITSTLVTQIGTNQSNISTLDSNKVDKVTGKGLSTNDFTNADKTKLDGIASGAEVNVQANWTESDTSSDAYIQNKPQNIVSDASYVHTDNNFTTALKDKLDGIASGAEVNVQANWNESDSSSDAFIQNKPTVITLTLSTTDIGEGAVLSANTLYGVYE